MKISYLVITVISLKVSIDYSPDLVKVEKDMNGDPVGHNETGVEDPEGAEWDNPK